MRPPSAQDLKTILSPLHAALADGIARLIHQESLQPGARLLETRLAENLGVATPPVRATLSHLQALGYIELDQQDAVLLERPPLPPPEPAPASDFDALLSLVARDRWLGRLADEVSVPDLMTTYGIEQVEAMQLFSRMAGLGMIQQEGEQQWRFDDLAYDPEIKADCYRYRMTLEPAALLDIGFSLNAEWAAEMVARHEHFLYSPWLESSSVAFFEMNVAFHEGLVASCGNGFIVNELKRISRRRRLANYAWPHGRDRVDASCREHLAILECLQNKRMGEAARLMRDHLADASRVHPDRRRSDTPPTGKRY